MQVHSLVAPCTVPLGLVAPGVSEADQRDLARAVGRVDVDVLDARDAVRVPLDEAIARLRLCNARVRLKNRHRHTVLALQQGLVYGLCSQFLQFTLQANDTDA